jgi:superoxide reductase
MMDRRDFIKTTAAVATLVSISNISSVFAKNEMMYTNIIYTKDNPGRWPGKEGSHSPQVTVNGTKVSVETKHPMSAEHFIVKHTLVLGDGTFVGEAIFTPKDKPISEYELPAGFKGKFFVTSFCNVHDFWLAETTI